MPVAAIALRRATLCIQRAVVATMRPVGGTAGGAVPRVVVVFAASQGIPRRVYPATPIILAAATGASAARGFGIAANCRAVTRRRRTGIHRLADARIDAADGRIATIGGANVAIVTVRVHILALSTTAWANLPRAGIVIVRTGTALHTSAASAASASATTGGCSHHEQLAL